MISTPFVASVNTSVKVCILYHHESFGDLGTHCLHIICTNTVHEHR